MWTKKSEISMSFKSKIFTIIIVPALFLILIFISPSKIYKLYTTLFYPKSEKTTNFFNRNNQIGKEKMIQDLFIEAGKLVQKLYFYGDKQELFNQDKPFKCGDESDLSLLNRSTKGVKLDDNYLRCNPHFLECYFSSRDLEVEFEKKKYHLYLERKFTPPNSIFYKGQRVYEVITAPYFALKVSLAIREFPNYSLSITLKNRCHESLLPSKEKTNYIFSKSSLKRDTFFNTLELPSYIREWAMDQNSSGILVDKFLVSRRDVVEWLSFQVGVQKEAKKMRPELLLPLQKREDWHLPATHLLPSEMAEYCHFRGKEILSARVFDASSFYPLENTEASDTSQFLNYKLPLHFLPWEEHIFSLNNSSEKNNHCAFFFTSECFNFAPLNFYSLNSSSWNGVSAILGGPLEYLSNPDNSRENIKASSFYFPKNSPWHFIGMRVSWDEKDFREENFSWIVPHSKDEYPPSKEALLSPFLNAFLLPSQAGHLMVGFRCMKILSPTPPPRN